jgi:multidrug efflux pump subunit AcrB
MAVPGPLSDEAAQRPSDGTKGKHTFTDAIVRVFLNSNLSLVLILLAVVLGAGALWFTPREEDPQIVVPLADVFVRAPGLSAGEVEQLVATPLEKLLYQIDGVEYVYSMSRPDEAVITVRFYVGEDRERSLVKLFKKIDESLDLVPPGVTGWVIKPVEIDDVPLLTLTLAGREATRQRGNEATGPEQGALASDYTLRRVAEEAVERLAAVKNVSRAYVVGGAPRTAYVYLDPDRLGAYQVAPLDVERALRAANVTQTAGDFSRLDSSVRVEVGRALTSPAELRELVLSVSNGRPVFLKDVADIVDGPAEPVSYVRHGWGLARGFAAHPGFTGTLVGGSDEATKRQSGEGQGGADSRSAVTIALAKKKGTNAVWVAEDVLKAAAELKREVIPDNVELVVTRNYGLTANDKVNELVEALAVAVVIVIALLTLSLGWREALIVAVAVPVVFGLTLAVNLLLGYTVNRVTLFALILSLGLLVDDPIVDVENIARHFGLRRRATRPLVLEAVAEVRPPLITATLAVVVSFLPMFFITGMMGPYMRPMALNVPVAMLMSMVVAFTITPWLTFHVLKQQYRHEGTKLRPTEEGGRSRHAGEDLADLRQSKLYRLFYPLMAPLLRSRRAAWTFLGVMGLLTVAAAGVAALRIVPLKMLPFDNKNELLLVLDFDEGTTLERSDAGVRAFETYLAGVPEVTDFTSYVGVASPMDFNGLVRHYYLRRGENVADIRVNLAGKKNRTQQSHGLGLRLRDELTALAHRQGANLKIVEMPPGPPVIASVVAEVYGRPDHTYDDLVAAAQTVRARLEREPGVVDVDDVLEAPQRKLVFVTDKEKAALNGVSVEEIAANLRIALAGGAAGIVHVAAERNPLQIELRLPRAVRSSADDLAALRVKGQSGTLVPLAELGRWEEERVAQTIYHKNLQRVVYVFAETAGRPPADCVVDVQADQRGSVVLRPHGDAGRTTGSGLVQPGEPRKLGSRTFLTSGGGVPWAVPAGIRVDFAGEGEWKITLDVFRDLGLAFGAAMIGIYVLLVAQTGSFAIPVVVMLAIPLTIVGVMPGFWLLNLVAGGQVGGYADPVFFTATGMIGMIALAGIVTRDSIILVDFIHLSLRRGRSLFDAIMESRVVRLRPILLTAGAAMLGAAPITIDPIFSGLAWSLIFGLFASTVFTLFVIPVAYWLIYERKPGHGLSTEEQESDSA